MDVLPVQLSRRKPPPSGAQYKAAEVHDPARERGHPARCAHSRLFESLDADGTRLATLATRAQMTHQSMGELIDAMERAGYVERVPDPADGRARLVRLTPQGQAMMRTALAELTDIQRAWLRRIAEAPAPDLAGALEWVLRVKDESLDQHAAPIRRPGLAPTPPPAGA